MVDRSSGGGGASDKVPLNKSFDTAETSSLYSEDLITQKVTALLDAESEVDVPSDDENDLLFIGASGNEDDEDDESIEVPPRAYDPLALYSSDTTKASAEEASDYANEASIGAMIANTRKKDLQEQDDASVSSLSSLYRSIIGFRRRVRSEWKEDKPFDEDSILESELGEGVEIIYGVGVFTGRNQQKKGSGFVARDPDDGMSDIEGIHEPTDVTCATRAKDDTTEGKQRSCSWLLCCLCCLIVLLITLIVGLAVGLRGDDDNNRNQVSKVAALGGDSSSAVPSISGPSSPIAKPMNGPSMDSAVPNSGATVSPQPSYSPKKAPSASPIHRPALAPTQEPTAAPTISPTIPPTSSPTDSPTPLPTNLPTPLPTDSPTSQPTDPPTPNPTPRPTPLSTVTPMSFPTSSPSTFPTKFPTTSPTLSPTGCQNTLSVEKNCHVQGDDLIIIEFFVCNPQEDDWIGIYVDNGDSDGGIPNPNELDRSYVTWAYTCGRRKCSDAPNSNRFAFDTRDMDLTQFRAFLVPGSAEEPYDSVAMSERFDIAEACF